MDEKSKQLLTNARDTLPLKPGSKEKYDYEYKRNDTNMNLLQADAALISSFEKENAEIIFRPDSIIACSMKILSIQQTLTNG